MMPYYITFFISIVLIYFSQRLINKGNKRMGIFLLIISILPITLLAGLRNVNLGYDTKIYGVPLFERVHNYSNYEFFNYLSTAKVEKGFLIVIFILDRICGNINFVLFGLQAIISISFIILLYSYKDKCSFPLTMLIYCCTLYTRSYDILRQGISIALIMLMIVMLDKQKYKKAILLYILSLFCHNSSFAAIIIPLFYIIEKIQVPDKIRYLIYMSGMLIIAGISTFYTDILKFLVSIGIVSSKYLIYIGEEFANSSLDIRFGVTIVKLIIVLCCLVYIRNKKNLDKKNIKWIMMLIFDFIINFLSYRVRNIDRIAWYCYYPALFIMAPQLIKIVKNNKYNKAIFYILISLLFLIEFTEKLITNRYHLNPYISMFN